MPTNLTDQDVDTTFAQILHVDGGITSALKPVYDGDGTASALQVSNQRIYAPGLAHALGGGGNVSLTGTTAETTLASVVIPANSMGPNGFVEVVCAWAWTNNANTKTPRVKFGGTTYVSNGLTTSQSAQDYKVIQNRGATNNQGGTTTTLGFGSSSVATVTSTADTTQDVTIDITGQLANAADTLTLVRWFVRVTYLP